MITAIREMRRAKGMTLDAVARACVPPSSAQMIGRLETGTRTVSIAWLNRIAAALGVAAADLVALPDRAGLPVAARLDDAGAHALRAAETVAPPAVPSGAVAVQVTGSVGDYRAGDAIWCTPLPPERFVEALHRDVLAPRAAGSFIFGRLLERGDDELHILPPGHGQRRQALVNPPWLAIAIRLVRSL